MDPVKLHDVTATALAAIFARVSLTPDTPENDRFHPVLTPEPKSRKPHDFMGFVRFCSNSENDFQCCTIGRSVTSPR